MESIHSKWCTIARMNGYDEYWYTDQGIYGQWYETIIRNESCDEYFKYYLDVIKGYVDDFAISVASLLNKLSIVKILIERGFTPEYTAIEYAYAFGQYDCLEYLISINAPFDCEYFLAISPKDESIDIRCVELLDRYIFNKKYSNVLADLQKDLIHELNPLPFGANYLRVIVKWKGLFKDL